MEPVVQYHDGKYLGVYLDVLLSCCMTYFILLDCNGTLADLVALQSFPIEENSEVRLAS